MGYFPFFLFLFFLVFLFPFSFPFFFPLHPLNQKVMLRVSDTQRSMNQNGCLVGGSVVYTPAGDYFVPLYKLLCCMCLSFLITKWLFSPATLSTFTS